MKICVYRLVLLLFSGWMCRSKSVFLLCFCMVFLILWCIDLRWFSLILFFHSQFLRRCRLRILGNLFSICFVLRTSFDKLIVCRDSVARILLDMCKRMFVRFYILLVFFWRLCFSLLYVLMVFLLNLLWCLVNRKFDSFFVCCSKLCSIWRLLCMLPSNLCLISIPVKLVF